MSTAYIVASHKEFVSVVMELSFSIGVNFLGKNKFKKLVTSGGK